MAKKAHPGFKAVAAKIARKDGASMKAAHAFGASMMAAGAILASATRNASHAAKRANPRLKRVK